MSETIPTTNVYARTLVWSMFRDSADEDYLVARWAAQAKLPFQFFWSAQQALEKYMKGALILNGVSVASFSHSLMPLYEELRKIAGRLLPDLLCPPNNFPRGASLAAREFETTHDFLTRMDDYGDPNNRYRHYGLTFYGFDLHKLDELCFRIRRTIFPLDMSFSNSDRSYRVVLQSEPNFQPHPKLAFIESKKGAELDQCNRTFKWRNFSFFCFDDVEDKKINSGVFSTNSEISMNFERGESGQEAIEWLLLNARFSRHDRDELRNEMHSNSD